MAAAKRPSGSSPSSAPRTGDAAPPAGKVKKKKQKKTSRGK